MRFGRATIGPRSEAKMNLREGTRRLALLLGAVGVILGGFAGYTELQSNLSQRARNVRFERLANSDAVKQAKAEPDGFAQNASQSAAEPGRSSGGAPITKPGFDPNAPYQTVLKFDPNAPYSRADDGQGSPQQMTLEQFGQRIKSKYPQYANLSDVDIAAKVLAKYPQYISVIASPDAISEWKTFDAKQREQAMTIMTPDQKLKLATELGYKAVPNAGTVDRGNIKTIHWTEDYRIESIETEDGQTLYPTPAPAGWTYLLIALYPIFGFFVPWSAVRAIGWVGAGFAENSK
jgi:hypothetical protein